MWKEITEECLATVESVHIKEGMLIYLFKGKKEKLGFFDLKGFHPMAGLEDKVKVSNGYQAKGGTWMKVYEQIEDPIQTVKLYEIPYGAAFRFPKGDPENIYIKFFERHMTIKTKPAGAKKSNAVVLLSNGQVYERARDCDVIPVKLVEAI